LPDLMMDAAFSSFLWIFLSKQCPLLASRSLLRYDPHLSSLLRNVRIDLCILVHSFIFLLEVKTFYLSFEILLTKHTPFPLVILYLANNNFGTSDAVDLFQPCNGLGNRMDLLKGQNLTVMFSVLVQFLLASLIKVETNSFWLW
jgi:hypothetical protein